MDYAVLMAVTDDYACCAASTIMSIRDNSPAVFEESDFIIYQTDMCEANIQVLTEICQGRAQFPQALTAEGSPWLVPLRKAPNCTQLLATNQAGSEFGLESLHAFALLGSYQKVLWLESDTYICKPLERLFALECDVAGLFGYKCPPGGRPGPFTHLLRNPGDNPDQFLQGAVILFASSPHSRAITLSQLQARAAEYATTPLIMMGGVIEHLIPYIAYYHKLRTALIPGDCNVTLGQNTLQEFNAAAVQHFGGGGCKPWRDGHVSLLYPQFMANIQKFRALGGVSVPEIDRSAPNFFNAEYTFALLHNLEILKDQLAGWSVISDPQLRFDFFATSGNPRFYFKEQREDLYLELYAMHTQSLQARLVMAPALRSPRHDVLFKNLHAYLTHGSVLPKSASIVGMGYQESAGCLQLQLIFLNIKAAADMLAILSSAAKAFICLPLQAEAASVRA